LTLERNSLKFIMKHFI